MNQLHQIIKLLQRMFLYLSIAPWSVHSLRLDIPLPKRIGKTKVLAPTEGIVLTKSSGCLIKFNPSDCCILVVTQSPAITRADIQNNHSSAPAVFTFSSPGMMPPYRPKSAFDAITGTQSIDQITCVSANLSSQSKYKLASEILILQQLDLCDSALVASNCSVCSACLKAQFRQRFSEEQSVLTNTGNESRSFEKILHDIVSVYLYHRPTCFLKTNCYLIVRWLTLVPPWKACNDGEVINLANQLLCTLKFKPIIYFLY